MWDRKAFIKDRFFYKTIDLKITGQLLKLVQSKRDFFSVLFSQLIKCQWQVVWLVRTIFVGIMLAYCHCQRLHIQKFFIKKQTYWFMDKYTTYFLFEIGFPRWRYRDKFSYIGSWQDTSRYVPWNILFTIDRNSCNYDKGRPKCWTLTMVDRKVDPKSGVAIVALVTTPLL